MRNSGMSVSGAPGTQPTTRTQLNDPMGNMLQGSTASFTQSIFTGDFGAAMKQTEELVKDAIFATSRMAITKFISRLLIGNDGADAAKSAAKSGTNIAEGTARLTRLQEKVINSGLDALETLARNGSIDMEEYTAYLTSVVVSASLENDQCEVFIDEQQKLNERNQEILQTLKDLGVLDGEPEIGQEIRIKDGKEEVVVTGLKDANGNDATVATLLNEYNKNSAMIQRLGYVINQTITNNSKVNDVIADGITTMTVKGEDMANTITNTATAIVNEGVTQLQNLVTKGIATLQADAVEAFTNSTIDTATAAAAPGLATAETVSTLGSGAGQAATIIANGVADGFAAGVRSATGNAAIGGIAASLAAGQSIGEAITGQIVGTMTDIVTNSINSAIEAGVESLMSDTESITIQSQTLKEDNLIQSNM